MKKALIVVSCLLVAVLAFLVAYDMVTWRDGLSEKPVLYLYPQEERQLTVTLDLEGSLDTVYPAPDDQRATDRGTQASWTVTASPDGTLTDASGRTYPSLFWDGPVRQESPQQGFVVAREDAGAVAAGILADPGRYENQTLDVTGPEALTLEEITQILTRVWGRPVTYVRETVEEAYESRKKWPAAQWQYDSWVSTYTSIARGEMDVVSTTVRDVTGRDPLTFEEVARAALASGR